MKGLQRTALALVVVATLLLANDRPAARADAPLDITIGDIGGPVATAVNVVLFPLNNLPSFFDRAGVRVNVLSTQMGEAVQMMMASNPPIIQGTGLGTVATGYEQGATDVKIFLGEDQRLPYELVVRKGITGIKQIKTLGVPGITSASSQSCQGMLKAVGMTANKDYDLVLLGISGARVAALQAGKVDGSCEISPYPELYHDKYGLQILRNNGALPYYALGAWAYNAKWGADPAHHEALVRLAMAVLSATQWAMNPANKQSLIDMMQKDMDVPRSSAEQLYHLEIEQGVMSPDCYLPKGAVEGVFSMMQTIGALDKMPANYAQYFDWSILRTAAQRLKVKVRASDY